MLNLARIGLTNDVVNRDCRLHFEGATHPETNPSARALSDLASALDQRFAPLVRAIESEIIPRLMLAHRAMDAKRSRDVPVELAKPSSKDVVALTQILLKQDARRALVNVEAMLSRGMMHETLYLELLAPAARCLGELWEADLCDFVEVTVALGRLHQVLRLLGPGFSEQAEFGIRDRKVLLAAVPGEQHSFGLAMVSEFFRHAGWDVRGGAAGTQSELASIVRSEWFDAAGFSVACECRLDGLTACICAIRSASLNDKIAILVGGPIFVGHPELVRLVGADASAADAREAVFEAENLVAVHR